MTDGGSETVRVNGERYPVDQANGRSVCIVTVRAAPKPQNATHDVLAILAEITAVSLVTTKLSNDSPIRGRFDITEAISSGTAPGTILTAAPLFLINQLRLAVAIFRNDAEVVWFFGATSYLLPVLAARLFGRRVIIQSRGDVPLTLLLSWKEHVPWPIARRLAGLVRVLERVNFALAHRIVTYSPTMAETIGLNPNGPKVSCLGSRFVDLDRFYPLAPLEERDQVIGFVGRLDVEKGIDTLLGVAKSLPEDVTFVLVGDGDYRGEAKRDLAPEIEAGQVELPGWIEHNEVPEYLNRFKLLVMPSEPTEGLPTIIAEAFACGTPVYATPVSGIPDLVVEGETGFLMRDRQIEAITERIQAILSRDDLPEISMRCRSVAEERYSKNAAVSRYREVLADI